MRLKEKGDLLEAGFSYLDMVMTVPSSAGLIVSLIMSGICFMELQQKNVLVEENYALFKVITEIVSIASIFSERVDPVMESNISQELIGLLLSSANRLAEINSKNIALKFYSKSEHQNPPEDLLSGNMALIFKKILSRNLFLTKVSPLTTTLSLKTWDSIFFHKKTCDLMEMYLETLSRSEDPICPMFLAQYYQLEGSWVGWFSRESFEKVRAESMKSLLAVKNWKFSDVENLLKWKILRRKTDGWLPERTTLLNLDPLTWFSTIEGVEFNSNTGQVDFITTKNSIPLIDINDIREVNNRGLYNTFFTLDPPDSSMKYHPFQEMKYFPDRLEGTNFLATMLHADYLLKMMTIGVEINPNNDFQSKLAAESFMKRLPDDLKDLLKPIHSRKNSSSQGGNIHRFWIEGGKINFQEEKDEKKGLISLRISGVKMIVKKHLMKRDATGNLIDDEEDKEDDDSAEAEFARVFTENYDLIGLYFPELLRLREIYKLAAIAKLINLKYLRYKEIIEKVKSEVNQESIAKSLNQMREQFGYPVSHYYANSDQLNKKFLSQVTDLLAKSHGFSWWEKTWTLQSEVKSWMNREKSNLLRILENQIHQKFLGPYLSLYDTFKKSNFYGKEEVFLAANNNPLKCSWVPAAFCAYEGSSRVYGGVGLNLKLQEANVPRFDVESKRVLYDGVGVRSIKQNRNDDKRGNNSISSQNSGGQNNKFEKISSENSIKKREALYASMSEAAYAGLATENAKNYSQDRIKQRLNELDNRYPELGLKNYDVIKSNQDMFAAKNKNTNEIIIAYRGSLGNIRDWTNNLMPGYISRHHTALEFANEIQKNYPKAKISVTGHSLGGGVADYVSRELNIPCETFNKAPTPSYKYIFDINSVDFENGEYGVIKVPIPSSSKVQSHHRIENDPIGWIGTSKENVHVHDNDHSLFSPKAAHRLENFFHLYEKKK